MGPYVYTMGKTLDLSAEQAKTLSTPKLRANLVLKMMFITFDVLYGRARSLPKFLVLEILARYPYWAWEKGSCRQLSALCAQTGAVDQKKVDELLHTLQLGRDSQDNEQWHMLLLNDIICQKGIRLKWLRHFFIPRVLVFFYYHMTALIYRVKPAASFAMNAAFESHAEHEYMLLAQEHPEWDAEEVNSYYFQYYPKQPSLGALLRRIALDERDHCYHSLEEYERITGRTCPSA